MSKWLKPVQLKREHIGLDLLKPSDRLGLLAAATDGNLWDLWYTGVPSADSVDQYIEDAVAEFEQDVALPFVVRDLRNDRVIGTTRFMNAEADHRRLEIGHTWYAASYHGTGSNAICKYVLLEYAFETLNCVAVEFRTHWHNIRSRKAIAKLGAKQDGVLRQHRILPDGSFRDTVVFSILASEWPAVKRGLEYQMRSRSSI